MHIYNTLTRRKEPFKPLVDGKVSMYVCGMTVYDYCHLGHARVMVAFDVITRYLRHRGYDVTYVRNITDIDDKILKRAEENGEPIDALTERMIAAMHEDEARLNVLPPSQEPRATRHIDDIIAMIETLIDKGFAYAAANGDVYYRVRKFTDYGKLNNRQLDDMRSGARVDVDVHKEDPLDFVLWKAAKPGEAHWHSPWGDGRPGWHIECSAMSTCCLGDTFDIHGGGPDLTFPHHENEIAQSEAATGKTYVNTWMHAGAVRVNQEKMSKSLGNFFTVHDQLEQGVPGEVIRFVFLGTHYRKPMDWTEKKREEAEATLSDWLDLTLGCEPTDPDAFTPAEPMVKAIADDLNTHLALTYLRTLRRDPQALLDNARWLGLLGDESRSAYRDLVTHIGFGVGAGASPVLAGLEMEFDAMRRKALATKDFSDLDAMKSALVAAGVEVRMSKVGVELVPGAEFDVKKLEGLL